MRRRHRRVVSDRLDGVASSGRVRVVGVAAGGSLVHRLAAIGLVPGAVVTVVRRRHPLLISLGGASLAIDRHTARSIVVEAAVE